METPDRESLQKFGGFDKGFGGKDCAPLQGPDDQLDMRSQIGEVVVYPSKSVHTNNLEGLGAPGYNSEKISNTVKNGGGRAVE